MSETDPGQDFERSFLGVAMEIFVNHFVQVRPDVDTIHSWKDHGQKYVFID
jgi:hypothetical protein